MYHQLHCLDILRRSFNRQRYFPNVTDAQFNYHRRKYIHSRTVIGELIKHCLARLDHCLDYMRQIVLCHADVDMIYWYASSLINWK